MSGVGGLILIVDLAMLYYYRRKHADYENSVATALKRDFYDALKDEWIYNFEDLLKVGANEHPKQVGHYKRRWFVNSLPALEQAQERRFFFFLSVSVPPFPQCSSISIEDVSH